MGSLEAFGWPGSSPATGWTKSNRFPARVGRGDIGCSPSLRLRGEGRGEGLGAEDPQLE
jgi:hypothetical protein